MTKQEQIDEMAKIVDEMYNVYTTTAADIAEGLYNAGYRKDAFNGWSGSTFVVLVRDIDEMIEELTKCRR